MDRRRREVGGDDDGDREDGGAANGDDGDGSSEDDDDDDEEATAAPSPDRYVEARSETWISLPSTWRRNPATSPPDPDPDPDKAGADDEEARDIQRSDSASKYASILPASSERSPPAGPGPRSPTVLSTERRRGPSTARSDSDLRSAAAE
jgi:hypothetical protein